MTNQEKKVKEYVGFKISQYIRITGFNVKQENAKNKLKALTEPKLKDWVREALAAGC